MSESAAQTGRRLQASVVTVCLNSERYLAEAMESVLAQGYSHIEYIVVDGGSTDGTLDIIRSFEQRFEGRLRWLSEPDNGIYDAMNKGIRMCKGELIGLLNSDDRYLPDAVEAIVSEYESELSLGAVYGDAVIIDEAGDVVRVERARPIDPAGKRPDWLPMCHQSLFVTRETYDRVGLYDTGYRILADYEFVLRCLTQGVAFRHVDARVAEFRLGGVCNLDTESANRERQRIRVLYGSNRVYEALRRARHSANMRVHGVLTRLMSGLRRTQS